ncbi:MAG: hypothetical protein SGI77_18010 [Pirellulaceae bacterium]|nr:hypothetical protein [Pirellulaceae bacterium]
MAHLSWFQKLYWRYLSKPVENRALYQHVISQPVVAILEIGIGNGERLKQVLSLVTVRTDVAQLRYAGVDPFESGNPGDGHLRLKDVHRMLAEKNIKAHLIPGDAASSLARVAHSVLPSDLIIIDHGWNENSADGAALAQWLPRLAQVDSAIFARQNRDQAFSRVALPAPLEFRKAA